MNDNWFGEYGDPLVRRSPRRCVSCAEPVLYRLASETGLAAGIGVLEGNQVLVADRVEAPALPPAQSLTQGAPATSAK